MSGHEKIQRHYDSLGERYDYHYDRSRGRSYHNHLSEHLIKMLPDGGLILDIGCGTGLFVEKYKAVRGGAIGIDISRGMIQQARRRSNGTDFIVGKGESLPFASTSFDAIASLLAFSYIRDPEKMLNEAHRVLKPGGTIAVCTLGKNLLTRCIPAIYHLGEIMQVRHPVVRNFGEHYFNDEEMLELFYCAGFEDVKTNWYSFAHIDMIDPFFTLARHIEPFVERHVPQLAYNICVTGKKPA